MFKIKGIFFSLDFDSLISFCRRHGIPSVRMRPQAFCLDSLNQYIVKCCKSAMSSPNSNVFSVIGKQRKV